MQINSIVEEIKRPRKDYEEPAKDYIANLKLNGVRVAEVLKLNDILDEARNNRLADLFEDYLRNYDTLLEFMSYTEVCVEIMLGDIYLESTGRKDKSWRFRNPKDHPLSILAEFYYLVFGTTDQEFEKDFKRWSERVGSKKAMMAVVKFLKNGKNDIFLDFKNYYLKILKTLVIFDEEPVYRALEQMHKENDRKMIPGGARSIALANAAINALEKIGTKRAVQSLFRIQRSARYQYPRLDKVLKILTYELKLSDAELEELKAPTYDFDESLSRVEQLGDFTVYMNLAPGYKMNRRIVDENGKEYSDFPKTGLAEFKDEIKELKGLEKIIWDDARKHRDEFEKTYRIGITWSYPDWLRNCILHPLKGYSGRRLIWEFTDPVGRRLTGMFSIQSGEEIASDGLGYGKIHDATGNLLPIMDQEWIVKLWHPVEAPFVEQQAWKDRVMQLQVVQPFKQAFREMYSLTTPELETSNYSNRFAAHILYKHQFLRIAAQKGWSVPSVSSFYGDNLPQGLCSNHILGHSIQFNVEYGVMDSTNMVTDRIIFDQNADLTSIPPLVFSEAMRDIDMFVSVCSIGVDPTWTPDRGNYAYWSHYTTSELGNSSVIRKEILDRILPGLSIKNKCLIEDRWLYVKGSLSTYKIHIGSGSVHMEPSGKHLCIVPQPAKKSESDSVYLPFEGDTMLSLILSKAFLLVNDTKITDKTILSQIKN